VRHLNIYSFYLIGKLLAPWGDVPKGATLGTLLVRTVGARVALGLLLRQEVLPIKSTAGAAKELSDAIDALMPADLNDVQIRFNEPAPTAGIRRTQEALGRLEAALAKEPGFAHVYSATPKGVFDIERLIESADDAIIGALREVLPDVATFDIRQSGKCLAFELPTAAGFHILRAVEAIIKAYYKALTGSEWDADHSQSQRNWGRYIDGLKSAGAKPAITGVLLDIKDNYRNPLMHPEDSLELDEAAALFGIAVSVMSFMLREINSVLNPGGDA